MTIKASEQPQAAGLGLCARREGFEPPTARSVVLHCTSPPILPDPSGSPFILVNGHIPEPGRTLIPAHHVGLGRNVVAVSDGRGQTRRLVTAAPAGRSLGRFSTSSI